MKSKIIAVFFLWVIYLINGDSITSQTQKAHPKQGIDTAKAVEALKKVADTNMPAITKLLTQLPSEPKVIIKPAKPKIIYVKVYADKPNDRHSKDYIPVEITKLQDKDTVIVIPAPGPPPIAKKPTFFQRLFRF